jgi:hypothetical protein
MKMATCPYNPAHKFIEEKLMFHVMRCKDGKKNKLMFSRCPFNSRHIVKNKDLDDHMMQCPNREET